MSDDTQSTLDGERDERLESVIAEYIRAAEAGNAPSSAQLLELHPEFSEELKQFLTQRNHLNRMADPIREFSDDLFQAIGPGQQLSYVGNYELLEEIARGGMGVVYKARQTTLGRIVAVKMIVSGRLASEQDVQRFHVEAQAAAGLQHPNIVSIHEVGQHEGWHYFSMEYVEGRDLSKILRENLLSAKTAATYVGQMAEAIHFAHQQGILHRDLKPSNILIDSHDQVRITDFGLAMRVDGGSDLTRTGQIVGTPSYMPPEQAQGKRALIGPGSDVYSLGAVLYECLTGRAPFRADSVLKTIEQVIHVEAASPRTLNTTIPRDLETICQKCLEKEPHRRYGTAQLLADDLVRFSEGRPIVARPVGTSERTWRWCRRNPLVAGLMATVVFSLIVGTTVSSYFAVAARQRARAEALERRRAELAQERTEQALGEAEQLRLQSEENARLLRRHLYVADMNLAQIAWDNNQVEYVRELLDRHRPGQGMEDLRRIEWFYWHQLCHQELLTLKGHTEWVKSVAFSPDGKRLLTGGDNTARFWNAVTGEPIHELKGHAGIVWSVAFSLSGERVITSGNDNTAKLWDAASGKQILTLEYAGGIRSVAFSPDGARIVTGNYDGTVRVWDTSTGQEILAIEGHKRKGQGREESRSQILGVAFNPDGSRIVTGSYDGTAKIWDTVTGQETLSLNGHTSVMCIAFNADGTRIVTGSSDETAKVWDAVTGEELLTLNGHKSEEFRSYVTGVAFSPDGSRIVTVGYDTTAKIWNAITGELIRTLKGHTYFVTSVAFSPDGTRILTGSADKTAKVWDAFSGKQYQTLNKALWSGVYGVAFSLDGTRLVTGSSDDNTATVWDAVTGKKMLTLDGHVGKVAGLAFSPDGKRIATGSSDTTAIVWDAVTGEQLRVLKGHTGPIVSAAFSPDGTRIATGGNDKTAKIWNAVTGKEIWTLTGHTQTIFTTAFAPDGMRLVTGSHDRTVKVWDLITSKNVWTKNDHTQVIISAAFSRDGTRIVTGSWDTTAMVWDAVTGEQLRVLKGHTGPILSAAFSPDGTRIFTGGSDTTARIWDADSGQKLLTIKGYHGKSLNCSSDAIRIWGDRNAVKLWFGPPTIPQD